MLTITEETWLNFFPSRLRGILLGVPAEARRLWQEIRLRPDQPLLIISGQGEVWLNLYAPAGGEGALLREDDLQGTFQLMAQRSVYALEEELRRGYLTLPGGHRLGFAGHAVLETGQIRLIRQISSLNLRLARAIPGAGQAVLPSLVSNGRLLSTLILSPPRCGKTTLLRDLIRQISRGRPDLGLPGRQVSLIDERSEVAGTYLGQPQLDVGPRTDVLDAAPKAEGMLLMLRAMSPDVLAVDELGGSADAEAVAEAAKAGVAVLATAHAGSTEEAARRPFLAGLLSGGFFQRLVILDASRGVGTVRSIWEPGRDGEEVGSCCASWVPSALSAGRVASAI